MATHTAEEVYEQHIKPLSALERLKLRAMLINDWKTLVGYDPAKHTRNITELCGLGAEIWEGIDAQEYVNKMRDDWDERS